MAICCNRFGRLSKFDGFPRSP
ncbi:hypothetical protein [Chlorogloea sp. CCALA 695]